MRSRNSYPGYVKQTAIITAYFPITQAAHFINLVCLHIKSFTSMKFSLFPLWLALGFLTDTPRVSAEEFMCSPLGICDFVEQDISVLKTCLDKFSNITVGSTQFGTHGKFSINSVGLNLPDDDGLYARSRRSAYGVRNPTAIVFAENTQDVVDTVNCARQAGYKVSPRGRGHSNIGSSVADGTVVIDMQYTCNVDAMVASIDRTKSGPHLIPGTKYVGTIKAEAGCCNANWLAAVYLGFDTEDFAMASIGTCPSVGIVGYSLGGGLGDASPLAGYALDLITEYEMVLADGSVVTVSEHENEDLYWANRGGGGGIGAITSVTFKVIQNPSLEAYTYMPLLPSSSGDAEWNIRWSNFMYDHAESYRFGGGSGLSGPRGINFLGSLEEGIDILTSAGLLDQDLMQPDVPPFFIVRDFEKTCVLNCTSTSAPAGILGVLEVRNQAEVQVYVICRTWLAGWIPDATARSRDVCDDLGVDSSYCECVKVGEDECYAKSPNVTTCAEKDVIEAIIQAASDPTSRLSRHGYDVNVLDVSDRGWPPATSTGQRGGLLMPRLEDSTLRNLTLNGDDINIGAHLAHGASHMVPEGATAMPWRDASFLSDGSFGTRKNTEILLQDKAFGGDIKKLKGYYSYLGPESLPHWEQLYFGEHVQKLKAIKANYDPTGLFDKPMQLSGSNSNSNGSMVGENGTKTPGDVPANANMTSDTYATQSSGDMTANATTTETKEP